MSTTTTPPATNATATESWSLPTWMNFRQADGSVNMPGVLFWFVMLVVLAFVLQWFGVVNVWAMKKVSGQGEDRADEFYSDL